MYGGDAKCDPGVDREGCVVPKLGEYACPWQRPMPSLDPCRNSIPCAARPAEIPK